MAAVFFGKQSFDCVAAPCGFAKQTKKDGEDHGSELLKSLRFSAFFN